MTAPSKAVQVEYWDLPPAYHRWKWRVLIAYCVFYAMNYLGRFNFSLVQSAVIDDLGITRADTGWINSWLFWGFALGDVVHGRLAERFGYRRVLAIGAIGTAIFNIVASFGDTVTAISVPWGLVGFVNAATWSPGIGLLAQWWPRRERGQAIGLVGMAAGFAMIAVWLVAPWMAAAYGWRAALRFPPLVTAALGIAYYFAVRDRPEHVGLPEYIESDEVSRQAESASGGSERGLSAYLHLMTNWRYFVACQVKGLDNIVRYGIVSWAPVYYAQVGGFDLRGMALLTFAYPVGLMTGPFTGGFISDRFFKSNRSYIIAISNLLCAAAILGIALSPADNIPLAVILLFSAGFTVNMAPIQALGVDLAGRRLAGTASGVMDAHGYFYGALQAWFFGWLSVAFVNGWFWVFLIMAASRLVAMSLIWRVKA